MGTASHPRSDASTYVLAADPTLDVILRLRSSASPVADGAEAAVAALGLRPRSETDPAADASLTIDIGGSAPPSGSSATLLATDERGRLLRIEDGWKWTNENYDLVVRADRSHAHLTLRPDLDAAHRRTATAYALRKGLTLLLPRTKRYPLHAAGLCSPDAAHGLVLTGPSGCGKSTLTAGLVDRGWTCLSDDLLAVALPPRPGSNLDADNAFRTYGLSQGIRLLPDAWNRLSDSGTASNGAEHPEPVYGAPRKHVRRIDADPAADVQGAPDWILFPDIVDRDESRLAPLDDTKALGLLLEQMHPPAALPNDAATAQLDAAAALVRQSQCRRLHAGRDLYDHPGRLETMLASAPDESFSFDDNP